MDIIDSFFFFNENQDLKFCYFLKVYIGI
jgi:hypothetical protein